MSEGFRRSRFKYVSRLRGCDGHVARPVEKWPFRISTYTKFVKVLNSLCRRSGQGVRRSRGSRPNYRDHCLPVKGFNPFTPKYNDILLRCSTIFYTSTVPEMKPFEFYFSLLNKKRTEVVVIQSEGLGKNHDKFIEKNERRNPRHVSKLNNNTTVDNAHL